MLVGHRQTDRDLTIVLLAKLAAILPGYADRVPALLGEAGVVDDQGADPTAALDDRQDTSADRRQHRRVGPVGLGQEMV